MNKNLKNCQLFNNLTDSEIELLLEKCFTTSRYQPEEMILLQNEVYDKLMIIAEGRVRNEMIDPNGRNLIIETLGPAQILAPAFLFGNDRKIPVTVTAIEKSEIVKISVQNLMDLMQKDKRVLENFMSLISNKAAFLSLKVKTFSFGTIKSKLASYLLEQSIRFNSLIFEIEDTQQQLSDRFGVTRPALARTLGQLVSEGAVRSEKKYFQITNLELLKKAAKGII